MGPKHWYFLYLAISAMNVATGVRDFKEGNAFGVLFSAFFACWMLREAIRIENKLG